MAPRIAILVGRRTKGSNMRAIATACQRGELPAQVGPVVAPSEDSPAAENARSIGLEPIVISPEAANYEELLLGALSGSDWICLAGYMRLLPEGILRAFPRRILNIHPALLPKFGGKGMYGLHVHRAVLAAGEVETGASVHFVNERYDEGEIVLQERCRVEPGDTPESLAARVSALEHRVYVAALQRLFAREEP